jgi:hypothetical protein
MRSKRNKPILGGAAAAALVCLAILAVAAAAAVQAGNRKDVQFTSEFPLDACNSLATSTAEGAQNRYLPLEIGRVWEMSNADCVAAGECDELEEVRVSILDETEMVGGTLTRVLEEREWVDSVLDEVSRNFLVECVGTEDVYYLGEDVEDGEGNPLPDGWRAGMGGAMPGILFPGGAFLLGARYHQEIAPDVAMDRAENKEMGLEVTVPAGTFSGCVLVEDTNPLEDPKGKEPADPKVYCPGIGIVMDEELVLMSYVDP